MRFRLTGVPGAILCILGTVLPAGGAGPSFPSAVVGLDLGTLLQARGSVEGLADASAQRELPPRVRVVVPWTQVEPEPGREEWSALDAVLQAIAAGGSRAVVCVTGSHPAYYPAGALPSPLEPAGLEPWLGFVRSVVRRAGSTLAAVEIWDGPQAAGFEPQVYAFLLKATALAARAEARAMGVEIAIVQGGVDWEALEWQRALWSFDTPAYVTAVAVRVPSATAEVRLRQALAAWLLEAAAHPPAPELWVHLMGEPALARVAAALGTSASVVLTPVGREPLARAADLAWLGGMGRLLAEGFAPAPLPEARLRDAANRERGPAEVLAALFDARTERTALAVQLSEAGLAAGEEAWLELALPEVRDTRFLDPATGQERRTRAEQAGGSVRLRVWAAPRPVVVLFRAARGGVALPGEALQVREARALTAEEIIARYQEVQRAQDDRLERWIARGRVDFHFRLAQAGSTVDVSIESRYFWQRGDALEWEQLGYLVNGNRVSWKRFPELPLIQPEKVVTLPLDLTLDRTYVYRLVGEETVGERAAYVLAFAPARPRAGESLYEGRVWIDRERFVRLKASVVQTNLEAPVLSNEEVDLYRPVRGPDGAEYWMLAEIRGQQIWNAGGRNFVVLREVGFAEYEINPPPDAFDAQRREAYASRHLMLRDTEAGYRYLVRTPEGGRAVKEAMDTSQWFAAAGLFKDSSLDSVVPLGGVNYFDYNLFQRNIQLNIFFAGVLAFVNATKPDLWHRRADWTLEATGFALRRDDKVFLGGEEQLPERIEFRSQHLAARFGVPLGDFLKLTLIGGWEILDYADDEEAAAAREARRDDPANPQDLSFVLPPDHTQRSAALQLEYNRRGYNLTLAASRSHRSRWAPWGLFDNAAQAFVDPEPLADRFSRWGLSAFKEWYLPRFQKIRGELNLLAGSDLDRFSRYRFSFFGDTRLSGFSGTGVRFDRGAIARAGYAFNLFDVVRFDVVLERALVEDARSAAGRQAFTGLGLSGNFVAPWKTVVSFGYGRAVGSEIPGLVGKQEFLLTVLKLF